MTDMEVAVPPFGHYENWHQQLALFLEGWLKPSKSKDKKKRKIQLEMFWWINTKVTVDMSAYIKGSV